MSSLLCDGIVVIGGAPSWASPGSIGSMAFNSLIAKNNDQQNQRRRYISVCAPLTNMTKHESNMTVFWLLALYKQKRTYKTSLLPIGKLPNYWYVRYLHLASILVSSH